MTERACARLASVAGRRRAFALATLLWVGAFAVPAFAGSQPPLFQSEASLAVQLHAPWRQLLARRAAAGRLPARLDYVDDQGNRHSVAATVETRGLTRLEVCEFPPIRLRFTRKATLGTVFEGQRSLKLVTHCLPGRSYAEYYRLEHLAYRIYNLLTPYSYLTRGLDIDYVESGERPKGAPRFAFVIERTRDMARRTGLEQARQERFGPSDLDARQLARFMLFQYLIGNTDFAVLSGPKPGECCHNVRMIVGEDRARHLPVPYDFDSSGLVDADYAAPHESLPIRRVRERLYRGFCAHNPAMEEARQEFLGHRQKILDMLRAQPGLGERRRDSAQRYLEAFFETLRTREGFEAVINEQCRK